MILDENGWITHMSILLMGPAHVGKSELIQSFLSGVAGGYFNGSSGWLVGNGRRPSGSSTLGRKPRAGRRTSLASTDSASNPENAQDEDKTDTDDNNNNNNNNAASDNGCYLQTYMPTIEDAYTIQFLMPPNPDYTAPFIPPPPPPDNAYLSQQSFQSSSSITLHDELLEEERERQNRQRIVLTLIDVGGHSRYSSLWPSVARAADAVMLVYDVGDRRSFDTIWSFFKGIAESKGTPPSKIPCTLVGTMVDTVGTGPDRRPREVTTEMGQSFANLLHVVFHETTALAPQSVNHVFRSLIKTAQAHAHNLHSKRGSLGSTILDSRPASEVSEADRVEVAGGTNHTKSTSGGSSAWGWLKPVNAGNAGTFRRRRSQWQSDSSFSMKSCTIKSVADFSRPLSQESSSSSVGTTHTSSYIDDPEASKQPSPKSPLSPKSPISPSALPPNLVQLSENCYMQSPNAPQAEKLSRRRGSSFLGTIERIHGGTLGKRWSVDSAKDLTEVLAASSSPRDSVTSGSSDREPIVSIGGLLVKGGASFGLEEPLKPPAVGSIRYKRDLIYKALVLDRKGADVATNEADDDNVSTRSNLPYGGTIDISHRMPFADKLSGSEEGKRELMSAPAPTHLPPRRPVSRPTSYTDSSSRESRGSIGSFSSVRSHEEKVHAKTPHFRGRAGSDIPSLPSSLTTPGGADTGDPAGKSGRVLHPILKRRSNSLVPFVGPRKSEPLKPEGPSKAPPTPERTLKKKPSVAKLETMMDELLKFEEDDKEYYALKNPEIVISHNHAGDISRTEEFNMSEGSASPYLESDHLHRASDDYSPASGHHSMHIMELNRASVEYSPLLEHMSMSVANQSDQVPPNEARQSFNSRFMSPEALLENESRRWSFRHTSDILDVFTESDTEHVKEERLSLLREFLEGLSETQVMELVKDYGNRVSGLGKVAFEENSA